MLWSCSNVGWGALLGAVIGALIAVDVTGDANTPGITFTAAGVLAGFAAVCGAVLGVLVNVGAWLVRRLGIDRRLAPFTSRDPAAPRRPVVLSHAFVLAAVLMLCIAVFVYDVVLRQAWLADEPRFGQQLALLVLAALLAGVALATIPLGLLLAIPLRRFDQHLALPFPANPMVRYLLWFAAPVICLLAWFVDTHREELGSLAAKMELAMVIIVIAAVWTRPGLRVRATRAVALRTLSVQIVVLGNFVGAAAFLAQSEETGETIQTLPAVGPALERLRGWTDVDGDHVSSVLGEFDCAPFDPKIRPGFTDVPGNEIDEDCDGSDGAAGAGDEAPLYSDALGSRKTRQYNVVWIVVDAVRADHTTMNDYAHDTTPYLAHLGEESLVFKGALSQSSATVIAFPSMLYGLNPDSIEWRRTEKLAPVERHIPLAERMKDAGYTTMAIVSHYMTENMTETFRGFEVIQEIGNTRAGRWRTGRAGATTIEGIRLIEDATAANKPFLLTMYYADPHASYADHEPDFAFEDSKTAHYDEEIAYVDRHIGFLIEYLRVTKSLWKDTIVIVTSDHGEEFKEHGDRFHAKTCHRESVHVPLVVRIPGVEAAVIDTPVALIDIVPTVLEVIGEPQPNEPLDGQSLLMPALRPEAVDAERPIFCSIISQKDNWGNFYRRSVRVGDRTLMQEFDTGVVKLFDTTADAEEKRDLAADPKQAETVERLRALLDHALTGNMSNQRLVN